MLSSAIATFAVANKKKYAIAGMNRTLSLLHPFDCFLSIISILFLRLDCLSQLVIAIPRLAATALTSMSLYSLGLAPLSITARSASYSCMSSNSLRSSIITGLNHWNAVMTSAIRRSRECQRCACRFSCFQTDAFSDSSHSCGMTMNRIQLSGPGIWSDSITSTPSARSA